MITKIVHFSDIHLRKSIERHTEYKEVFNKTYEELKNIKPDRIVIVGDLFHDFIDTSHEQDIIAKDFLSNLSSISKTIIVRGNHDFRKKNHTRVDSVKHIVELIDRPNLIYYEKTGFYQDDNVVWCVHNHGEKVMKAKSNPWIHNLSKKPHGEDLTYIDLFHDPVYGCVLDNDTKGINNNYTKLSDFKGDYGFFGDIHKLQFLDKDKKFAYPSSLIQQTFGEHPREHGFLLWDISTGDVKFNEISNRFRLINLYIERGEDDIEYDNIDDLLENNDITPNTSIKVFWKDNAPFINVTNELKIRKSIERIHGIKDVIFDKKRIYSDIISSKMLTESIDVNKKENQHEIFKEYLKGMNYPDSDINEILKIDDIITERLNHVESKNIEWSIHKFWFDNFKSYGDENVVDWFGKDGIIQINGKNQQGKTTLLDAICYVLFGTTLATNKLGGAKSEKAGDQRYINNKRELDNCSGGVVLSINNELFTLERTTNRSWTKKGTVKAASTLIEYYKGDVISDENKITGENKNRTQQKIDTVLGQFGDFIRLALINADNLNSMLSMSRADFIDSLINDAGYDIFDKKSKEFKEYKKTINFGKLKIDPLSHENEIKTSKENIETCNEKIVSIKEFLSITKEKIEKYVFEKDEKNKKINVIDENIINIDEDEISRRLSEYNDKIKKNLEVQAKTEIQLKELPNTYDDSLLNHYYKLIQEENDSILNLKVDINDFNVEITNEKNSHLQIKEKLNILVKDEKQNNILKAQEIQHKNTELNNTFKEFINEFSHNIENDINNLKNDIKIKENDLKNIFDEAKKIKKTTEELIKKRKETEESSYCPTCKRLWDNDEHAHHNLEELLKEKDNEINTYKQSLNELKEKTVPIQHDISTLKEKIDIESKKLENINSGIYDSFEEIQQKYEEKLANVEILRSQINELKSLNESLDKEKFESFPNIMEEVKRIEALKEETKAKILEIKEKIIDKEREIREKRSMISHNEKKISVLEKEKEDYNRYQKMLLESKDSKIELEKLRLNLEKFNEKLIIYNNNKKYIEENEQIEKDVKEIDNEINILNRLIENKSEENLKYNSELSLLNENVSRLEKELKVYKEQTDKENRYKLYEGCLDRKGIPTYLLKKSIHIINEKIEDMLSDINISAFFNEDLQLKMSNKEKLDVEINALEASGAERTLITTALKMALRQINVKSRPNFILLDEVMGKLVEDKVDEFINLLDKMKDDIEKVIIIEHVHPINYNHIINVTKDSFGISTLTFE